MFDANVLICESRIEVTDRHPEGRSGPASYRWRRYPHDRHEMRYGDRYGEIRWSLQIYGIYARWNSCIASLLFFSSLKYVILIYHPCTFGLFPRFVFIDAECRNRIMKDIILYFDTSSCRSIWLVYGREVCTSYCRFFPYTYEWWSRESESDTTEGRGYRKKMMGDRKAPGYRRYVWDTAPTGSE